MNMWLELLAKDLAKTMTGRPLGHAARLNGLERQEARELCGLLRQQDGLAGWDIMVVTSQPEDAEEVSIDVAVERRNDKSQSRLFLVPVDLVTEAAASLADTEVLEALHYLKPLAEKLCKGLPAELKSLVSEAMKRVPAGWRLDYLSALPATPTMEDCGREFWRLGLIPDLCPQQERLPENRDCVKKLIQGTGGSFYKAVDNLGLADVNLKKRLVALLRNHPPLSRDWLRHIATQPDLELSFDRWTFPDREKVNLKAIEVHSFIDPKTRQAHKWSGLIFQNDSLLASIRPEDKARVTIKWSTEPTTPSGKPIYEISLETAEVDPVPLLLETQAHKPNSTIQSWKFKPAEVEGVEGGSLRVQVVVRAYSEDGEEPIVGKSDEFILISEEIQATPHSVFPLTRSLPDFMLERATTSKGVPQVTWSTLDPKAGIKIELDERQRKRIALNPVLAKAEQLILAEPNKLGCLTNQLSRELRWHPENIQWSPLDPYLAQLFNKEWWTARRKIFTATQAISGINLIEGRELYPYLDDILLYVRGYARALETLLDQGTDDPAAQNILAELLALDTLSIKAPSNESGISKSNTIGILLSPLHPLRLLWHLGHEALILHWIEKAKGKRSKAVLPKPDVALQLDGGNCPAFLADTSNIFYYFESPSFFWPLYVNCAEADPHKIAALIRWNLGLGTIEALTEGQHIAISALSSRLRTYLELHPYVRTLKMNAINCGDGQILAQSLADLDDHRGSEEYEEEEPVDLSCRDYEIRLYGPAPVYQIGSFFDDCVGQRRRGQGLPQRLDRLFSPGKNFLRPHLFWAKRELRDIETGEDLPEEAHLSFINEYFRAQPALVLQEKLASAVSAYGLQIDLTDHFFLGDAEQVWLRTAWLPPGHQVAPHTSDRRLTQMLLRLQRLLSQAVTRLMNGTDNDWPATRVAASSDQFNLFNTLHESSDWVLTIDRNLGVELFDSPLAAGPLKENAERFLIDYAPLQVGSAGQQLMVSTSWIEEIRELLRTTLREMFISPTDLACGEVLRLLKSISGRLVMRVARFPAIAKEAVSLAVVREVLRGEGKLEKAFLLPVDEHIPIFSSVGSKKQPENQRRPDLFLVRPRLDRKNLLEIDVIEVKYRRHRYMAYDRTLWADMLAATRSGAETLTRVYFPAESTDVLDLPLQQRLLRNILTFYAKRAYRHGLLEADAAADTIKWLAILGQDDITVQIRHYGFIFSPELDCDTEDEQFEEMNITLIGREALPRYTSFHPSEPPSIPARQFEGEVAGQRPPAANSQTPENYFDKSAQRKITIDDQIEKPQEISILIGHEPKTERAVYFRPSIRGNPHALIVGIPGMGKTTAIKNICFALAQSNVYPFIFDFHGDLAQDFSQALQPEQCLILNAAQGLPFNPLEVDPVRRQQEKGWITHYYEVAEIFANLYPSFGELQIGKIRKILRQCYEGAGFTANPTYSPAPGLFEFWQCLQEQAKIDKEARKISTRLEPIFELGLFRKDLDSSISLSNLLAQTTIFDLHSLDNEENQRVAASFFIQRLYRDMFSHGERGCLRNAVILDEAHRVARLSLIPKMMQECRKYGILFILASQRVEDFDKGVLDSAGNHLYLRVNYPDAKRLSAYLGGKETLSDLTQRLQNLHKYHALFHSEENRPFKHILLAKK